MISALLFLQYHSIRNRLASQVKRLQHPKYLVTVIVGAVYFYYIFFRRFSYTPARRPWSEIAPENLAFIEALAALLLFAVVLLGWLIPNQRAALAFTEAEVAFLFPAPISKRGLIHFKLLRSQAAILFTTLFLTLAFNRGRSHVWTQAAGWWLILSMLNLHMLGSSFARTMLLDRGITNWQRRTAILIVVGLVAAGVIFWGMRTMPGAEAANFDSLARLRNYIHEALTTGPAPYLLFPFWLVVHPFFAASGTAFLIALWPVVLLIAIHYWWVVRSNVAFEEASVEASQKLAEKVAAIRSGNWQAARKTIKAKRAPFKLSSTGFPPIALLWKNLISAGQAFTARLWISIGIMTVGVSIAFGQTEGPRHSGILPIVGLIAAMLLFWSLLIGPVAMRQDLRQDLLLADVLKLFPLRGWQIVLGEVLAPVAILSGIQWLLLILVVGFFPPMRGGIEWTLLLACGLGTALILPFLNLISLLIPNAAVLLMPAWFQIGKTGAQGIEATGQRLIFMIGQLIIFVVALVPAGVVFAVALLIGRMLSLPLVGSIPMASVIAAVILAVEGALGLMLLGRLFERFDLSAELTG